MFCEILRYHSAPDVTLGVMRIDGNFVCHTLEDPYKFEKIDRETRIPAGVYRLNLRTDGGMTDRYAERFPDIHRGMLWLRDVPGFEWVYFHIGNTVGDTEGCILVGTLPGLGYRTLVNSTAAYQKVYPILAGGTQEKEGCLVSVKDI